MLLNLLLGKLTQKPSLRPLGNCWLISVLQVSLGTMEATDSALMHYLQPMQQIERNPRRPSLCQPSNWAADMLKHCYFNSSATELWKQFFFPLKNTEVLLLTLIQNRLFSKILRLLSEVSFSRMQVPNSRPEDLSEITHISIPLYLCHSLHVQIYANNFLLKTHLWCTGNWYTWKKGFAPFA